MAAHAAAQVIATRIVSHDAFNGVVFIYPEGLRESIGTVFATIHQVF
jgi:hypothetical protein